MSYIKKAVNKLYAKYKTRCPYELAGHLGIEIWEYALPKTRGFVFKDGDRTIICVKADLPWQEKRAVVAHEIGHIALHPSIVGHYFIKENTFIYSGKLEREANLFAAMLLMDEHPEYGETIEYYAARKDVPCSLVKVLWDDGAKKCF